ncbi:membrane protein [Formosimonas limnophila]|uniref:Membrane protein n=2 Tax=Formosimonas limnophila TaxID=1384487 RepID=A0A8J3FZ67_9BURK|nr:membrane protein [Formosimonas limnophila]
MMIPNFWNVVSNLGFLIVGICGLYQLWFTHSLRLVTAVKTSYIVFFAGVSLVAFGSAYYHRFPSNVTLVWDRLPMTLAFMALMSFSLAEFLSITWGRVVLWPLLLMGVISVVYWYWGELRGSGDLRFYALVQFLPMILLLVLFTFGHRVFKDNSGYWWLLLAYLLAKVAEHFDIQIDQWTSGLMAGHALKHIFSASGLWLLLRCFTKRTEAMSKTHG